MGGCDGSVQGRGWPLSSRAAAGLLAGHCSLLGCALGARLLSPLAPCSPRSVTQGGKGVLGQRDLGKMVCDHV